jgi:hypothetical protein
VSGFDPTFTASGTGARAGSVPDPGTVAGTSRFLREDAIWAIPQAGPPGPLPPPPGPGLDQWACNAAGYIIYDLCYKLVKSAVDTNFLTLATNAIIAFAFDGLATILVPLEILDTAFLSWLENWVATVVVANISTFEAHLLDQVLWSKFHCFIYNEIRTAGGVSNTILLAAGVALAASGISPALVTNGVALILQQFGVMTVGPMPLAAFVQNYDCSSCAMTGATTTAIPPQAAFDLVVSDGTNRETFVTEIDVVHGSVSAAGTVVTLTPELEVDHNGTLVGVRPAINVIDGSNITLTVADDPMDHRVNLTVATSGALGMTNPMTTAGDIIVAGTAGAPARLAKGSDGQVLTVDPTTHLLVWSTPAAAGVTSVGATAPITSSGGSTPAIGISTPLAALYGGTGLDGHAAPSGDLLIGNGAGFALGALVPGTNIAIALISGSLVISSTGGGGGWNAGFTAPPAAAAWGWTHQGTASVVDIVNGVRLSWAGNDGSFHGISQTVSAAPYTATCAFAAMATGSNYVGFGMYLQAGSGNTILYIVNYSNLWTLVQYQGDSNLGRTSSVINPGGFREIYYPLLWMRIFDNGTNRVYQVSADGAAWTNFYSEASATYITPTKVGILAGGYDVSVLTVYQDLYSWSVTSP